MRILVTGSRDWDDRKTIHRALADVFEASWDEDIILVHGGARGADLIAASYAYAMKWAVELHAAPWGIHPKAAGIIRNIEMVDAGADICVAFIKDKSRGATHCANYAESKGIPVRKFEINTEGSRLVGWITPDPYNQPEEFGLETILQGDRSTQSYEFSIFAAWRHTATGELYYASDSGCSCPSPFETYKTLADLTGPFTDAGAVTQAAMAWCGEFWDGDSADRIEFISKVNDLRRRLEG